MYFTKVKIKNYKSFGLEYNELILNPNSTTIIGKNESGKSNLLQALAEINFFSNANFQNKCNKFSDDSVEIEAELVFDDSDKVDLNGLEEKVTKASFAHGKICTLDGALAQLVHNDEELNNSKNALLNIISKIEVKGSGDVNTKKAILDWLSAPSEICQVATNKQVLTYIGQWAILKMSISEREEAKKLHNNIKQRLNYFMDLLPNVYVYDSQSYASRYTLDEVSKINDKESSLKNLLQLAEILPEQLISAMKTTTDPGRRVLEKSEINNKIRKNIGDEFCKFYSVEKVEIMMSIENGYFDLLINTDKYPMPFSERSNGLRWYLDLFIQLKTQNLLGKRILLLIDEPGVQLHIDAQQELLSLFNTLSKTNQIVYTTHSPFMIDTEKLSTIRLVERINGLSRIYNKAHSADMDNVSKMETLSPLIKALGFSPRFNIGPKYDELNIIVEGISDYYYILGAAMQCGIDLNGFNVIPCVGASAVHNVASILIGWNCDFKIVLDYDTQSFNEINNLKKLGLIENKDYFVYNLAKIDSAQMKSKPFVVENMFDEIDKRCFDQGEKHLSSLKFYTMSKDKEMKLSQTTKDRFLRLFDAMGINSN